jgi:glycyl-tRNA synthetase
MNGQPAELVRLGDAVRSKLINNETLGYFIGRIYLFMTKIGVDKNRLRFRQHMNNEMAHYACDCWDAECQLSYGWIECIGCADRSCYDLTQHMKFSNQQLVAQRQLSVQRKVQLKKIKTHGKIIGQSFDKYTSIVTEYLHNLSENEGHILHEKLDNG